MNPSRAALEKKLRAYVGKEIGPPEVAPLAVNEAMIHHWCEVLGDRNPIYTDPDRAAASIHKGIVAPPAMLQAWILRGLELAEPAPRAGDLQHELHTLLSESGYPAVVATNCEQEYTRYLRPGDRLTATTVIESISEEKATALGIGYFIDTRTTFRDQKGEVVGSMLFRVLRFRPHEAARPASSRETAPEKPRRPRPPLGHDNRWWWEAIQAGELRIQRCSSCGALRHPPRPMCGRCRSTEWDSIVASGQGRVHSYVVCHHPKFPGFEYPLVVALVDLAEGTRLVANLIGIEPGRIRIGMPVRVSIEAVDDDWKLPFFRPGE